MSRENSVSVHRFDLVASSKSKTLADDWNCLEYK